MSEAQSIRVSRLGKRAVSIPKGVTVAIDGGHITCKGPKGEISRQVHELVQVQQDGETLTMHPVRHDRNFAQYQGLTRALVQNMVTGVMEGYKVSLDLSGVGYRATLKGTELTLALGLSHQVVHQLHPAVTVKIETIDEGGTKRPRLHLESYDKEALGQTAARIRSYRPPEPYKGKGVRYTGEHIRTKAGKTGK